MGVFKILHGRLTFNIHITLMKIKVKTLSIKREAKSIMLSDFETQLEAHCCSQLRSISLWRAER